MPLPSLLLLASHTSSFPHAPPASVAAACSASAACWPYPRRSSLPALSHAGSRSAGREGCSASLRSTMAVLAGYLCLRDLQAMATPSVAARLASSRQPRRPRACPMPPRRARYDGHALRSLARPARRCCSSHHNAGSRGHPPRRTPRQGPSSYPGRVAHDGLRSNSLPRLDLASSCPPRASALHLPILPFGDQRPRGWAPHVERVLAALARRSNLIGNADVALL